MPTFSFFFQLFRIQKLIYKTRSCFIQLEKQIFASLWVVGDSLLFNKITNLKEIEMEDFANM